MGIFARLFGTERVDVRELKKALLGLERDRRRKERELERLGRRRDKVVDGMRQARKSGDKLRVDTLWEELKHLKVETAMCGREARVTHLETLGLKRYVWGLERLERAGDRQGARRLIERVRASGLDDKLAMQTLREDEYLAELQTILEDAGLDAEDTLAASDDDPEKAAFLAELDAINEAEAEGDEDSRRARESRLRERLLRETDGGEA